MTKSGKVSLVKEATSEADATAAVIRAAPNAENVFMMYGRKG